MDETPGFLLLRNLSQIATPVGPKPVRGAAMRQLRLIDDAAVVVSEGRFAWVGPESQLPLDLRVRIDHDIDASRGTLLP